MLATISSCSDDFQSPDVNRDGVTGITLMIPNTEGATQFAKTRSADAETRGATRAGEEGAIIDGDLWLFAYATNPANNYIEKLNVADAQLEQNAYKKVTVTLAPDTYQMYVVANLSNYLSNITLSKDLSRTDLENAILNFSSDKPLSLENGLPMACKNTEIKLTPGGTAVENGKVEIEAGTNKTIFADLTFLCSKVRYTLLFDRSDFSQAFGTSSFDLTGTAISNVANVTKWYSPAAADYTSPFSLSGSPEAKQYPANVSTLEQDGETLGKLEGDANANADKMAWQEVLYLPENLSTEDSKKTTLTLNTSVAGQASSYQLVLNSRNTNQTGSTLLERGRFYDIVLRAKSRDIYDLSNITVSEWTTENLLVDFTHTFLNLSQTEDIEVKSLEPFYLGYQTDGVGGVKFECKNTMDNGTSIISYKTDASQPNTLVLQINPSINVADVDPTNRKGVAKVELTAGNIKKTIEVKYDMSPVFIITPTERTIGFIKNGSNLTEFEYITNLGGFKIRLDSEQKNANKNVPCSYTQGTGSYLSKLNIDKASGSTNSEGKIIMTEVTTDGPSTSTVYNFIIEPEKFPKDESEENYRKYVKVTVQPKMDDYRIYFRAINDYFVTNNEWDENGNVNKGYQYEFLADLGYVLPKENEEPWKDFWNENGHHGNNDHLKNKNPGPDVSRHRIYIYNQKGNNDDWANPGSNVIYFTKFFINDNNNSDKPYDNKMTSDYNNLGWYYKDLGANAQGTNMSEDGSINNDPYYRIPRRGETLLIFHNNLESGGNQYGDYIAHRVATSNEPGVPLFSYSDNIGWYLYDPTRDPVFNCYDDKPVIEDVEYTIYSDKEMKGWYRNFGKWRGDPNWFITIHAEHWNGKVDMNKEVYFNNKKYYCNKLQFKAPRGEHDKAIVIKFNDNQESMLFGGEIFKNDTGTYVSGSWQEGSPF